MSLSIEKVQRFAWNAILKNMEANLMITYAKTSEDAEGKKDLVQTVLQHCIAVGEAAIALAKAKKYDELPLNVIGFICALHDIGKITQGFQHKIIAGVDKNQADSWYPEFKESLKEEMQYGYHSGAAQFILSIEFPMFKDLISIIDRHHGYTPYKNGQKIEDFEEDNYYRYEDYIKSCLFNERKEFINQLVDYFGISLEVKLRIEKPIVNLQLSGLLKFADWIASKYLNKAKIDNVKKETFEVFLNNLKLSENGFIKHKGLSFFDIFEVEAWSSQKKVIDLVDNYGFYLVEQQTGKGKTETALYSAYKAICSELCTGIYFALPTQVTSNATYLRTEKFLEKVAGKDFTGKLVHSNSSLFLEELKKDSKSKNCDKEDEKKDNEDFFDFKHARLLGDVVTGTVDQALMALQNFKFNFARAFALYKKVIIIDEIHSYDAYTSALVKRLVTFCQENKCIVIGLSATVSEKLKHELFPSMKQFSQSYPLLTFQKVGGNVQEVCLDESPVEKKYDFKVSGIAASKNEAVKAVEAGQNVLWIENTVKGAQSAYRWFNIHGCGGKSSLLHSKFTASDRLKKEKECLAMFGKDSTCRPNGYIVVATQVMEQSLDVDFDILFTKPCPPDSFGQRIGRIGRHRDGIFKVVLICDDSLALSWFKDEDECENSGIIYPKHVLQSFYSYLRDKTEVSYPRDYRSQIEAAYSEEPKLFDQSLEEAWKEQKKKFEDKNIEKLKLEENRAANYMKTNEQSTAATREIKEDKSILLFKTSSLKDLLNGSQISSSARLTMEELLHCKENSVRTSRFFSIQYVLPSKFENLGYDYVAYVDSEDNVILISEFGEVSTPFYYNSQVGMFKD